MVRLERDLENEVIGTQGAAGILTHRNSQRRRRLQCGKCGEWVAPKGGTGETLGLPDTVSRSVAYPVGILIGVELKRDRKTEVNANQILRLDEGSSVIAYTPEASLAFHLAMRDLLRSLPAEAVSAFNAAVSAIPDLVIRDTPEARALARKALRAPVALKVRRQEKAAINRAVSVVNRRSERTGG